MVCDKENGVCVWQSCVRLCVKHGVKDGVWKMVCERWSVTVCERWCVSKWCVKDGVWKRVRFVKDGVVKDGAWQVVDAPATRNEGGCHQAPRLPRETMVDVTKCHACHAKRRWMLTSATPATQSAVASPACVKEGVWQSCVWKLWVTKLWVTKLYVKEGAAEEGEEAEAGYRIKNKNLTQRCGEKQNHKIESNPTSSAAEVSKIGNYRRGELLSCMDGRANPLMDRKVVGAVLFGMVAAVTSTTTAGCSVV